MAEPIEFVTENLEDEFRDVEQQESSDSPIEESSNSMFEIPTDEPEEITAEEAISTDIPLVPVEETGHLTALVCDVCLELNLTHPKSIRECARCGKAFCYHYASSIDVQFCVNCMSDMTVEKRTITKTYEHRNDETGQLSFYRRRAREIKISGLDWLFAQRKIPELSDTELDLTIEYHRNILGLMIAEQEKKRADKMHRYAGVRIHIPTNSTTDITHSTVTTVKKTRTISKNKAAEQLATILKDLLAKGMTPEAIAKMVGGKK